MIIVTMTHTTALDQREPYIQGHKQFIANCITSGALIAAGPTNDVAGGVLLMNGTANEAEELMEQDPFIKFNVSRYVITSFKVKACQAQHDSLLELEV